MILPNNTGGWFLQSLIILANQTDRSPNNTLEDFLHLPMGASTDPKSPQCYGVYGCFSIEYPWTTVTRPVSLYPESPSKINVNYPVFNRHSRFSPRKLDLNDPKKTKNIGINPYGNIYFIAHGYIDSGDRPWIQGMTNALLDEDPQGTATVIVVDWGHGSSPPYTQAVANIRLIGAITAHIIHMLYEELSLPNAYKVHMIGHSLGAHLCGYAGYYLQKDFGLTLGRITALDPAEPLFTDTDPIVRLDRTDANYVDVIHTDTVPFTSGGLGMRMPIGHVDFYPNGGFNNPGCDSPVQEYIMQEKGSLFWGVQQFVSCNHIRAHQFMTDSIRSKCPFNGISCDNYDDFKEGYCFDCNQDDGYRCFKFGLKSIDSYEQLVSQGKIMDAEPIKVYLMTNGKSPYCRTHFKVTIKISSSIESRMHGGEVGDMSIIIHADQYNATEKMRLSPEIVSRYYEPGLEYTAVTPGRDIGIPKYAYLEWEYKANPLNPLTWRILTTPRVYVEYITIESLEHRSKLKLCPIFGTPVQADTENLFKDEYCKDHNKRFSTDTNRYDD